jgi:hypothetical protein
MTRKIQLLSNKNQEFEQFEHKYSIYYGKDLQKMSSKP